MHGGGAWGSSGVTDTLIHNADPTLDGSGNGSGAIAGAQLGYNIQRGHVVFGLETDIGYPGLQRAGPILGMEEIRVNGSYDKPPACLYGDVTGRLGYAADRVLLYAKGGAAFRADVKATTTATTGGITVSLFSTSVTATRFPFGPLEWAPNMW